MMKQEKVKEVIRRLSAIIPDPRCELDFTTPWQLLVATILSAQSTDKIVNTVTPELFKQFPTIQSMADASLEEIDRLIQRVNFHNNKARSLKGAAQMIMSKYGGEVPQTLEELDELPGVARKTANVVLGNAFGIASGIAVDTHVIRLARALGLTEETDPVKIEQDLMQIVPKEMWINFSHYLILYGRRFHGAKLKSVENLPLHDLYV